MEVLLKSFETVKQTSINQQHQIEELTNQLLLFQQQYTQSLQEKDNQIQQLQKENEQLKEQLTKLQQLQKEN